ncbi:MAG: hypothetical protein M3Q69_13925, partial [Acidobacteriota bacterium]|nr:hypothetical protein [Acidobacteriota bacterium]
MKLRAACAAAVLLFCATAFAQTVTFTDVVPFVISGTTDAAPGTRVRMTVGEAVGETQVGLDRTWSLLWTAPLKTGTYDLRIDINGQTETRLLRVQLRGNVVRQSGIEPETPHYAEPEPPEPSLQELTDRWRIAPPPYELDEHSRGRLDPYHQNVLKGDLPIHHDAEGIDTFLVLTGISDSLVESRTLPTPSGPSSARPGSYRFFGRDAQGVFGQNLILSADLFQGDTTFQPIRQRVKATLIANLNHLRVEENAIVKPDVRRGTERTDGHVALQEIFYERKLGDLTPNYDFVSLRAGVQPFSSDFRGFVFTDTNLGVRVFGNYAANRYQYNLA